MRHINIFLGTQNGVFRVGVKKFMLKKFMCFLGPPNKGGHTDSFWETSRAQDLVLLESPTEGCVCVCARHKSENCSNNS